MEKLTGIERVELLKREIALADAYTYEEAYNVLCEIGFELYNNRGMHYQLVVDNENVSLRGAFTSGTGCIDVWEDRADTIAVIECNKETERLFNSNNILESLDVQGREKLESEIKDSYFFNKEEDGEKTLEELVDEYAYDFNFEDFMQENCESDYEEAMNTLIEDERDYYAEQLFDEIQRGIQNLKYMLEEIEG